MSKLMQKDRVDEFVKQVQRGVDAWLRAGEMYVKMLEEDPDVADRIAAQFPDLSPSVLSRFEEIGRKQLHPRLVLLSGVGPRKLRQMPYSQQERYLNEPIDMLVMDGDTQDVLRVDVRNVSAPVSKQIFAGDHVRSIPEQRAYIEAVRQIEAARQSDTDALASSPWKIRGKRLIVSEPCVIDKSEVHAIFSALTG